ncbi:hypothetical protein pdam_00019051, partial [Pocillopora damicornis]
SGPTLCAHFSRRESFATYDRLSSQTPFYGKRVLPVKPSRRSICKTMSMNALRNGRLGAALAWCLRSKDSTFAAFISESGTNFTHVLTKGLKFQKVGVA